MSESQQQIEELLADPEIHRLVENIATECEQTWGIAAECARRSVLTSIRDPSVFASVCRNWRAAKVERASFASLEMSIRGCLVDGFLKELLADEKFMDALKLVAREVGYTWNLQSKMALHSIFSAIGAPDILAGIYKEWTSAKLAGRNLGLVTVIVRRRAHDWFRKDARRAYHSSFHTLSAEIEIEIHLGAFDRELRHNPFVQLANQRGTLWIRKELMCFAQGATRKRQAWLVHRRLIDEVDYTTLRNELDCSPGALRVRMHKALRAFLKHIQECHPGLL